MVRDIQHVPGEVAGAMVESLEHPGYFAQVRVDVDAGTVAWPNGLDLAPEVLHGDYEAENPLGFYDITPDRQPA